LVEVGNGSLRYAPKKSDNFVVGFLALGDEMIEGDIDDEPPNVDNINDHDWIEGSQEIDVDIVLLEDVIGSVGEVAEKTSLEGTDAGEIVQMLHPCSVCEWNLDAWGQELRCYVDMVEDQLHH
jgi:hypothetical protein